MAVATHTVPVASLPCCATDDSKSCDCSCEKCCAPDVLHVITPINNYYCYKRRYELFQEYVKHMESLPGIRLYIVEVALGDRPFVATDKNNPRHMQLRTNAVIWHKENMINQMAENLPRNWKYMAWVDGDVEFKDREIAYSTIHQLQKYDVVQMFQSVVNLGPKGEVLNTHESFFSQYAKNNFVVPRDFKKYAVWHPGFAWACTRKAYNDMGRLIDFAILGAGDHHMALALVNAVEQSCPTQMHPNYRKKLIQWQDRVERTIQRNCGYVKGTIIHGFHGRFADRKYSERWSILIDTQFDPEVHIKNDWQGLYIFDAPNPRLRDLIRRYFDERNEDTIDL